MIPGKVYTPQFIVAAAWRRRWWIAVPFGALAATVLVGVLSIPHTFRSFAKLQVLPEPASQGMFQGAPQVSVGERLSGVAQETLTRARLEAIIASVGLYENLRRSTVMENVIIQMRHDITFDIVDRDVFEVGFKSQDRQVALTVAERLVALFLEENARNRGQRAVAATAFLGAQVEDTRRQLEEQEKKIEAYRLQYPGQLPSQMEANMQGLNNSQMRLRSLTDSTIRDRDQRLFLQRQLELALSTDTATSVGALSPGGAAGTQPTEPADELSRAQATLRALEERLTPEHPDVQSARRVVANLTGKDRASSGATRAGTGASRRVNSRAEEIRAQIELIDRQLANRLDEERELRGKIDLYTRRVESVPVREAELSALTRDYEDLKRVYSNLIQREQEAKMTADLEQKAIGDRFRVLEPARLPEKPHSPSRRNLFALGLLAALGISIGLAGIIEFRDSSLRDEGDVVASLQLPVLATIPVLNGTTPGRSR